jgi:NADPH:quinone reductase-like Zn-dependent oxidoreductase
MRRLPDPEPDPDQVKIEVHAAGVSFADILARLGLYPEGPKPPCVVGYEVAGHVVAVGGGVEGFAVGDRVVSAVRFGGYASAAVANARDTMLVPEDWSFEEAAALPGAYTTAYAALIGHGHLYPGERVLIHSAAGGLGIAAVQIAKAVGAEVFGAATEWKHPVLRRHGVDHVVGRRGTTVLEEVRAIAGEPQPIDIALDPLGGQSLRDSYALLASGGRLIVCGSAGYVSGLEASRRHVLDQLKQYPSFSAARLLADSKSVIGLNMLALGDRHGGVGRYLTPLRPWIEAGSLRPVVAARFPLENGADAHRFVHMRRNIGRVVLTVALEGAGEPRQ